MSWCYDPHGQEQRGRDAGRWGERYDYDHQERMRNAKWESDSCDAYYARGYKQEIERQEEERREEEHREEERIDRQAKYEVWQRQQEKEDQYNELLYGDIEERCASSIQGRRRRKHENTSDKNQSK